MEFKSELRHTRGVFGPASHSVLAPDTMKNNIVFLHTPMHTATVFVFELFVRHSLYGYGISWNDLVADNGYLVNGCKTLSKWKCDFRMPDDKFHVIQIHIQSNESSLISKEGGNLFSLIGQAFSRTYPTIITMRDPIAVLITQSNRLRQNNPEMEQEEFERQLRSSIEVLRYAILLADRSIGLHVAIETCKTLEERQNLVKALFKYVGLGLDGEDHIMHVTKHWKKINTLSIKDNPLKDAYEQQNLEFLLENLPGVEDILEKKEIFIPYLKKLGYEDLFWWK